MSTLSPTCDDAWRQGTGAQARLVATTGQKIENVAGSAAEFLSTNCPSGYTFKPMEWKLACAWNTCSSARGQALPKELLRSSTGQWFSFFLCLQVSHLSSRTTNQRWAECGSLVKWGREELILHFPRVTTPRVPLERHKMESWGKRRTIGLGTSRSSGSNTGGWNYTQFSPSES